jgi:ABC-2 type transport system permease protein
MNDLIRAELLKLRTLRMFWWSVAASLAFVPVSIAQTMFGNPGSVSVDSSEGVRHAISAASSGAGLVLLIGIVAMAGEFRHNTVTSTFLITPDRKRVVGAKLAALGIVGVGVAVLASFLTLAIALPWLASRNVVVTSHVTDIAVTLLGGIASTAIYGMVGVGFGALVTNQTLAITLALGWSLLIESLLVGFAPGVGRWLPGGAAGALSSIPTPHSGLLPMWAGAFLFAGYGLAFAAAGTRLVLRRDIA